MLTQGALTGIKVLDLSRLLPGPFCSMILADHGADVIAIEDGTKHGEEVFFNGVNRNKRHMSLNLKTTKGRQIFFELAKKADVILEGFRPGVVKRLGVDYETVKAINPGIIYCAITGFGQTGPMKDRVGHDVNFLSESGILDLMGDPDQPPSIPGVLIADIAGGAMNGAIGILLALMARNTTGHGQYIDISMTDGLAGFMIVPHFFSQLSGQAQQRSRTTLSHRYACYNTYETSDKRYLALGAVEAVFWQKLCILLGAPEYIPLQYDENQRTDVISWLKDVFLRHTAAHWQKVLEKADVCCSIVKTLDQAMAGKLFREREMVVELAGSNDNLVTTFGVPVKLSHTPGKVRTPPEGFGKSTTDILSDLGYSLEEIRGFKLDKII
ncbi:MAG: CoA transferase [Desulfobacteraceae bacterium]|nr:CoA transferase [Desulfobacteraceae bacterium]